jgi:hypothetical protein
MSNSLAMSESAYVLSPEEVADQLRAAFRLESDEEVSQERSTPTGFASLDTVLHGFAAVVAEQTQQQTQVEYVPLARVTNGQLWVARLSSVRTEEQADLFQFTLQFPTGYPLLLLAGNENWVVENAPALVHQLDQLLRGPVHLSRYITALAGQWAVSEAETER